MKIQRRTVDKLIRRGMKLWGLSDWDITWKYSSAFGCAACIDPSFWTERRAEITLDRKLFQDMERKFQFRTIVHELGHPVVYPIARSLSDWADHIIPKGKQREAYEDTINSAENIVIDWIVVRVMGL